MRLLRRRGRCWRPRVREGVIIAQRLMDGREGLPRLVFLVVGASRF
jgi:hypothetical protein